MRVEFAIVYAPSQGLRPVVGALAQATLDACRDVYQTEIFKVWDLETGKELFTVDRRSGTRGNANANVMSILIYNKYFKTETAICPPSERA